MFIILKTFEILFSTNSMILTRTDYILLNNLFLNYYQNVYFVEILHRENKLKELLILNTEQNLYILINNIKY